MSLAQKYRKSLEERWCLLLKTIHPHRDRYDGVVVDVKRQHIVLCNIDDLEFDDLLVIPKKVITGYRDGRFESCINEILRHNGAIKHVRLPRWLAACNALPEIVEEIQSRDIWPGVEILWSNQTRNAYYIGPIVRQVEDGFWLRCYGADGKWEKEFHIAYDEIFRITIDGPYEKHFNAYMRSKERG